MRRIVVVAVTVLGLALSPSALAGWAPTRVVAPGIDPILAVGDTGDAGIVTTARDPRHGPPGAVRFSLMTPGGRFGTPASIPAVTYTAVFAGDCGVNPIPSPAPSCAVAPTALALPGDGRAVVLYGSANANLGAPPAVLRVIVDRRSSAQIPAISAASGGVIDQGALTATADGEVIYAGTPSNYESVQTGVLNPTTDGFVTGPFRGFGTSLPSKVGLYPDDAGGTYLMPAPVGDGCTAIAYRPAHGRFRLGYQPAPCTDTGGVGNPIGLVAAGNGEAALFRYSLNRNDQYYNGENLTLQIGHFGHFGPKRVVDLDGYDAFPPFRHGHAPTGGIGADADGVLTLAWWECGLNVCAVHARTATFAGALRPPKVLTPGALVLRVADSAVAWQGCGPRGGCRVDVSSVQAGGRFAPAQRVGPGSLLWLKDDHRGDLLLVWLAPGGRVDAATRRAGAVRFSAPRVLSGPGVAADTVKAGYGPRGDAIVAWSRSGETSAAIYRRPVPAQMRG